jgi:hypothetical protein
MRNLKSELIMKAWDGLNPNVISHRISMSHKYWIIFFNPHDAHRDEYRRLIGPVRITIRHRLNGEWL